MPIAKRNAGPRLQLILRSATTVSLALGALLAARAPAAAQADLGVAAYAEHCASCHGADAAAFARRSIKVSGMAAVVAKSGRPVSAFLSSHGAADATERAAIAALFAAAITP